MNIRPISFAGAPETNASSDFKARTSKPQAYPRQETPSAASGLNGKEKGKKSTFKKVAAGVAILCAAAAGLGYAASKGKLNPTENGNQILETVKKPLKTAGDFIYEKAGSLISKIKPAIKEAGDEFIQTDV